MMAIFSQSQSPLLFGKSDFAAGMTKTAKNRVLGAANAVVGNMLPLNFL
jgi:hypothetical protein